MVVSLKEWQPTDGLVLEDEALKAVKDLKNSLVVAGPGAGKTELLAQKACCLLETNSCNNPKRILAISFKKDAASNLKERVSLRLSNQLENRFTSQTFDSFAKSILDRFLSALPEEYRPNKDYEIVDKQQNEIVKAFAKYNVFLNNKHLKKYYFNYLISEKLPVEKGSLNENVWKFLLRGDENNKATLSFPMITLLAIYILENNPLILMSLRETYSHLFLDEFQDTTGLQYELVSVCFINTNTSITAVGDNRQRIMIWAGAKRDIFESYKHDFKSIEYTLKMNHRSAPRLLEIQKIVNNYLQDSPFTPIPNPKWSKNDGIAEIWYFSDSKNEAKMIALKIKDLIQNYNVCANDICIIVKQTVDKYAKSIVEELRILNINARNETVFQDLLKEDVVHLIINTLKSALDTSNSNSWLSIWNSKIFFEGMQGTKNEYIFDKLREEVKQSLKIILGKLSSVTSVDELRMLFIEIINFYDLNKIRKYYPQYSQGTYINKLRENLEEYLYQYFQETNDWLLAISVFEGKDSIPIMTIHKSKGLEYESVFFIGFDDKAFWSFSEQEQEDTCTFFVGLSRAKRYLYFTFSEKRQWTYCSNKNISILYQMLSESKVVEELNL
ncbi:UvrD-helicase domain-containing protein [Jeotgalibacillus proteolyticus]|uniref:DNA 3'-5' helicase n=1 Tax=Jeotgalibacillus proteolyticus TaxID=2082395 RepID=A0A2S5G617_9BACL|nr:ATP-dependent helicase [Jeotgalibacillus proteolyticus]PPA68430.1 ATP-dependent helicase [Jeotgalibacillus proteolyticus]